jgi:hypothetical protein
MPKTTRLSVETNGTGKAQNPNYRKMHITTQVHLKFIVTKKEETKERL